LDIQEVREIGRKEAEESAGLCMWIMVVDFQQERKFYNRRRPGLVEDGEEILLSLKGRDVLGVDKL